MIGGDLDANTFLLPLAPWNYAKPINLSGLRLRSVLDRRGLSGAEAHLIHRIPSQHI